MLEISLPSMPSFDHVDEQLLSRAWVIDPEEVETQAASRSKSGEKELWNGEFYVIFGADETRLWTKAMDYDLKSGGAPQFRELEIPGESRKPLGRT